MKYLLSILVIMMMAIGASAANPVFHGWYADPEAVIYGDTYWIYPTSSLPFEEQTYMDAFSSKDLKTWIKHPRIITNEDVKWAKKAMWAPAAIKKGDKYYLFFSANNVYEGEEGGIGVAVADRPEGPYKDLIGKPLINDIVCERLLPSDKPGRTGAQPIDQFVFRNDEDGEYYMFYGGWGHCMLVHLADDFKSLKPLPNGKMFMEVTPENYTEGPFMFKRHGKYYFMWSEGDWTKANYYVNYSISDSPFGPFKSKGRILESDGKLGTGAGHHSVINIPGTDEYYMVYHMHPLGDTDGNHREIWIDRMEFDSNGDIIPVKITKKGVKARKFFESGHVWKKTDPNADNESFVNALMSDMTLQEKIGQLNLPVGGDSKTGLVYNDALDKYTLNGQIGGFFNVIGMKSVAELQKLAVEKGPHGIPLLAGNDVVHGLETVFPIPLALSCSWDMPSIERAAQISASEATADGINWVYSPMVDICRDPRWGRIAEGAGEDPYLGSKVAAAFVNGYQGSNLASDSTVMACVKHFALYGASEAGLDYNPVDMSRNQMFNYYLPPYKAAVDAGCVSLMTGFNFVDGTACTASRWLITDVLRKDWGFKGFVVTDYASINDMDIMGIAKKEDAALLAFNAGTDMDMVSLAFLDNLEKAIADGRVSETDIDNACRRILMAKAELGLFDDPYRYCNKERNKTIINNDRYRAEARNIAAETFVLLKNKNNTLPLQKKGKIALIGPMADAGNNMCGMWSLLCNPNDDKSLLTAFREAIGDEAELIYARGSNLYYDENMQVDTHYLYPLDRGDDSALHAEALKAAQEADVIVCAMGESAGLSGESASRVDITIPDTQRDLLKKLATTGKPIVLVLFTGRPLVLDWEEKNLASILNVWSPGSEGADAIADVVFGEKSPCGKLTTTFPRAIGQIPLYYNHLSSTRPEAEEGRFWRYNGNYVDCSTKPLYPFGYGMSYTDVSYGVPTISSATLHKGGSLEVSVNVTNIGDYDTAEIVQLYIRDRYASVARPVKELKGFNRIELKSGETRKVTFTITDDDLKFYNADLEYVYEPGDFEIMVGPNSDDVQTLKFYVQ
ncbi:MAG: beta-glucosidase BglX [Clostridiales bacterium]|nr:beta-glucosidase BglX [Clostridiales bacterium]